MSYSRDNYYHIKELYETRGKAELHIEQSNI